MSNSFFKVSGFSPRFNTVSGALRFADSLSLGTFDIFMYKRGLLYMIYSYVDSVLVNCYSRF